MKKFIFILSLFGFMSACVNLPEKTAEVSTPDDVSKREVEASTPTKVLKKKSEVSVPDVPQKKAETSVPSVPMNQVVVSVPGMVCQMCVHGMRKVFKDSVQNPEKDVLVDLAKKTVKLNLVTVLSDEEIEKRVVQAGYKADKINRL